MKKLTYILFILAALLPITPVFAQAASCSLVNNNEGGADFMGDCGPINNGGTTYTYVDIQSGRVSTSPNLSTALAPVAGCTFQSAGDTGGGTFIGTCGSINDNGDKTTALRVGTGVTSNPTPCTQLATTPGYSAADQATCKQLYAQCSATPGNAECEKAAAQNTVTDKIRAQCTSSSSDCAAQRQAADNAFVSCDIASGVSACATQAQAAAAQTADAQLQARISNQVGAPTEPSAVTTSDFQASQTLGDGSLGYTLLEPLPGFTSNKDLNLASILNYFFKILISFGGFIAVVALILGGITYMVSDVVNKKSEALKRIQAALWGLLLLIASYLILYTINPQLLIFSLFANPVAGLDTMINANGTSVNPATQPAYLQSATNDCTRVGKTMVQLGTSPNSPWVCE